VLAVTISGGAIALHRLCPHKRAENKHKPEEKGLSKKIVFNIAVAEDTDHTGR